MTPEPNRRFRFKLSYSLKTLFVVVTVLGLCLPMLVREYKEWERNRSWQKLLHSTELQSSIFVELDAEDFPGGNDKITEIKH